MVLCEFTVGRTGLQSASRLDSASGVTQSNCGQCERSPTHTHSVNALNVSRRPRNGKKDNHGCSRSGGKKASSGIAASRSDSLSFKSTMSASHDLQTNSQSKFREPTRKTKRGCTRANLGEELLHNTVLMTSAAAVLFAQTLKPFTSAMAGNGLNWKLVIKSGGMPSSHSAAVTSIATVLAIQRGASDPLFGMALVGACVVMYDAQGVRRAVGKQAEVINTLVVPYLSRPKKRPPARPLSTGPNPAPPPSAIGTELAQFPLRAELDFVSGNGAGSDGVEGVGRRGIGTPIGLELATQKDVELEFVESREISSSPSPSSSPLSPPFSYSLSTLKSNQEGEGPRGKSLVTGAQNIILQGEQSRSREFWEAAQEQPSMVGGEVEMQEVGELEGWRHIPLKESVGHTKTEVVAGALAGVVVGIVLGGSGVFNLR